MGEADFAQNQTSQACQETLKRYEQAADAGAIAPQHRAGHQDQRAGTNAPQGRLLASTRSANA